MEAFPSGHSTAAMSLALAGVLLAPPRLKAVAAAGGALLVLAVGFSIVVQAWHFPSDVLGGHLVAAAWSYASAAGRTAWLRRPGGVGLARSAAHRGRWILAAGVGALGGATAAVGTALVIARLSEGTSLAAGQAAFLAVAAVISLSALAVFAAASRHAEA